jgi:AraC family transcriptional regulator
MQAMPEEKPLAVDFSQEDALEQILPRPPILSSHEAGWKGILLEYHRQPPYEIPEIYSNQHGVAIFTQAPAPMRVERTLDGCFQSEQIVEGDIVVIPANICHSACWETEGNFIFFGFEPTVFADAVYESVDPGRVEIVPHFSTPDPLIYQLGLALKSELESDGLGSRLYAEMTANLLAVHLLRHYCAQKPTIKDYTGGLPKYKLRQVIDYINDHLDQNLSLAELAQLVEMSPHYFSRLFKRSTGFAPHQYLIKCRIERAKQLLLKGKLTIAEVAYSVGFANQGHLNYHFKRLVGITPKTMLRQK